MRLNCSNFSIIIEKILCKTYNSVAPFPQKFILEGYARTVSAVNQECKLLFFVKIYSSNLGLNISINMIF